MKGLVEGMNVNHLWLKSDHTAPSFNPVTFIDLTFSANSRSSSSPANGCTISYQLTMHVFKYKSSRKNKGNSAQAEIEEANIVSNAHQ